MTGWLTRIRQTLGELRAARLSSVELCRRLDYEGWENLHGLPPATLLFLLGPLGSRRLARRVLDDYLDAPESAVLLPAPAGEESVDADFFGTRVRCAVGPARRALERRSPAIWTLALARPRGRWRIYFLSPVSPMDGESAAALTRRYLDVLEEWRDSAG